MSVYLFSTYTCKITWVRIVLLLYAEYDLQILVKLDKGDLADCSTLATQLLHKA